jgi:hypothetical protein
MPNAGGGPGLLWRRPWVAIADGRRARPDAMVLIRNLLFARIIVGCWSQRIA